MTLLGHEKGNLIGRDKVSPRQEILGRCREEKQVKTLWPYLLGRSNKKMTRGGQIAALLRVKKRAKQAWKFVFETNTNEPGVGS